MTAVDLVAAVALKERIAVLEAELHALYVARRELFIVMDETMTRRDIGAFWGISNVAVSHVVNGNKFKLPPDFRPTLTE